MTILFSTEIANFRVDFIWINASNFFVNYDIIAHISHTLPCVLLMPSYTFHMDTVLFILIQYEFEVQPRKSIYQLVHIHNFTNSIQLYSIQMKPF